MRERLRKLVAQFNSLKNRVTALEGGGKFYLNVPLVSFSDTVPVSVTENVAVPVACELTGIVAICDGSHGTAPITIEVKDQAFGDVLSTALTIDPGEESSNTAAVPAVIDTLNDDFVAGERIQLIADATGATGLGTGLFATLEFTPTA